MPITVDLVPSPAAADSVSVHFTAHWLAFYCNCWCFLYPPGPGPGGESCAHSFHKLPVCVYPTDANQSSLLATFAPSWIFSLSLSVSACEDPRIFGFLVCLVTSTAFSLFLRLPVSDSLGEKKRKHCCRSLDAKHTPHHTHTLNAAHKLTFFLIKSQCVQFRRRQRQSNTTTRIQKKWVSEWTTESRKQKQKVANCCLPSSLVGGSALPGALCIAGS